MAGTLISLRGPLLFLVFLGGGGLVRAAGNDTADPTRPPAAIPAAAASIPGSPAEELMLQAVFLPKGGRPSAWINGERVSLGAKMGEDKLVSIKETEVVLRGPGGEKHLLLVPAVSMKPATAVSGTRRRETKHETP